MEVGRSFSYARIAPADGGVTLWSPTINTSSGRRRHLDLVQILLPAGSPSSMLCLWSHERGTHRIRRDRVKSLRSALKDLMTRKPYQLSCQMYEPLWAVLSMRPQSLKLPDLMSNHWIRMRHHASAAIRVMQAQLSLEYTISVASNSA